MSKPLNIVGHGLAGCVMAMTLHRKHIPFHLKGMTLPGEASMASSGLIAPITGRRYVKAWDIDIYLPFALNFYRWTEELLGEKFFHEVEILRFLSNEEAIVAWESRCADPEYAQYVSNKRFDFADQWQRPYGILKGGYQLNTPGWLTAVRNYLINRNELTLTHSPVTIDPTTDTILATGAVDKRYGHGIIPNKGEALIVRLPEWHVPIIMKDELFIVPLEDEMYWVGSCYEPWSIDPLPTPDGKERILKSIAKMYSGSVEVVHHLVGFRPTVNDRRPIIGRLPGYDQAYIFNGMGTKTTSLAPFWADQLSDLITEGLSLPKEVSPERY